MRELSLRQKQILHFIKEEVRKKGYPPSVREIGAAMGLNSSSTVHGHLRRLEARGLIRRDPSKPRAIEVLDGAPKADKNVRSVPLVGRVTAGQPILAEQNVEDYLPLPQELTGEGEVFLLRVQGESMIGAGILNGDYVLVQQQPTALNGEIVVALLEDEATVKRFFKEKDHIRLQPENPHMEPILAEFVRILGKVIGLYRVIH
ncbi:MAG: transcriptional repressor LexA [Firmicutes bacterium]|nr:transcriptional repressor LexA [Bacillota bacterium]